MVSLADGTYRIALIGVFVGTAAATLGLETNEGTAFAVKLTAETTPVFDERKTNIKYTIHSAPDSGTFTFEAGGVASSAITWPPTPSSINSSLFSLATGLTCISVSDGLYQAMEIELESVLPTRDVDRLIPQLNVSGLIGTRAMDVRTMTQSRASRNEVQQVTIATDPVGGAFTLSFLGQTTGTLAYNATAGDVQTALLALSTIGAGGVQVSGQSGGPWLVSFTGSLAASDQPMMTGNASGLTLSSSAAVTTIQVTTPTGPNWWTNAENWSLGHVPTAGEVATFENTSVPCKYGIDGVPAFEALDIYRSYTGSGIGLAPVRADGSPETLPQDLKLTDNAGAFKLRIGLGDDGAGPSLIRINGDEQHIVASVFYTQASVGDGTYAVMLSGLLDELHIGDAIVGVGVTAGATGVIGKLRMRQRGNQNGSVVEWGELVTANDVQVQIGTLRAGSAPKSLFMIGGEAIVRGQGDMESMVIRASTVRWLAKGEFGKQGLISALAVDGDGQAVLTSDGHGLINGSRVFISGIKGIRGLPDGYYGISDVTTNTFTLVGTAPLKPYAATSPSAVADYYEANTARWGLADAVVIGAGATVDMSEQAEIRTIGAPILIQSDDAVFNDPLVTVPDLRLRYDPGVQETAMGTRCVVRRDELAAASASAGYAGGAGGFVISELS